MAMARPCIQRAYLSGSLPGAFGLTDGGAAPRPGATAEQQPILLDCTFGFFGKDKIAHLQRHTAGDMQDKIFHHNKANPGQECVPGNFGGFSRPRSADSIFPVAGPKMRIAHRKSRLTRKSSDQPGPGHHARTQNPCQLFAVDLSLVYHLDSKRFRMFQLVLNI